MMRCLCMFLCSAPTNKFNHPDIQALFITYSQLYDCIGSTKWGSPIRRLAADVHFSSDSGPQALAIVDSSSCSSLISPSTSSTSRILPPTSDLRPPSSLAAPPCPAMAVGQLSQDELNEIYAFAVDLGRKAGSLLMERVEQRIAGETQPQSFEEKDNAVDIVTQTDEGK